ncbi:hypothetical protein CMO93_03540 [Candidatus Woesearchaeota archaeon]|nr:hypothetical protein [Candidatus Woesearchaeota archaeon]|tara:strand:+ start:6435 stop:6665 length:231 start_codon:yes stop_codon:yes gene_type:complete
MNQQFLTLGILIILIGFAIVIISSLTGSQKTESKIAVGGFVGFIPFGFANDKRILYFLLAFMAVMIIFFILPRILK